MTFRQQQGCVHSRKSGRHASPAASATQSVSRLPDRTNRGLASVVAVLVLGGVLMAICLQPTGDVDMPTQLFQAAVAGDEATVRRLIDDGADLDVRDASGVTPLMSATLAGHPRVVRMLIQAGADPHQRHPTGATPLYLAAGARVGADASVRELLRAGLGADDSNREGQTPLMVAAMYNQYEAVVLLIEAGADPNARDVRGRSSLSYAACGTNGDESLRLLLALGVDQDNVDVDGRTPLHEAAAQGDATVTAALIAAGADTRQPDAAGHTPADLARQRNERDVMSAMGTSRRRPARTRHRAAAEDAMTSIGLE